MRKYGKFERMPDGTRAKPPEPKDLLLQTYFTSLVSMILCVSMFFGTSYAWFSSEVNNTGNEIYIGTLDVGLYKMVGGAPVDLKDNQDVKLFDQNIRWEPGYTSLETIKIKNEGDLAFLYELSFVDHGNDPDTLKAIGKNFVVYVHAGDYADGEKVPSSFVDIVKDAEKVGNWKPVRDGEKIATLADILNKKIPVLSDSMTDVRADAADPTAVTPGPNDSKPTEDTYIIALHMSEDAEETKDVSIMGKKLQLNVCLKAYQRAHEQDGFGGTYDLAELKAKVSDLGKLAVSYEDQTDPNVKTIKTMSLEAAYQLLPMESAEKIKEASYRNYMVDFVVWADKEVPAKALALAGYHKAWDPTVTGNWSVLTPDQVIPAKKEIRLIGSLGNNFALTYEQLCQMAGSGSGLQCGIEDLAIAEDTNLKLEIRLYKTVQNGEGAYEIADENDYIVLGTHEYLIKGNP